WRSNRGLCRRVLGADEASLRAVMGTRGDASAAAGRATTGAEPSSSGATTVAALVSETPRRCASAVRERVGASPRPRRAASSTGTRTCIRLVGCPLHHPEQASLHHLAGVCL